MTATARVLRLGGVVALGAAANIAFAWGFSLTSRPRPFTFIAVAPGEGWPRTPPAGWPAPALKSVRQQPGMRAALYHLDLFPDDGGTSYRMSLRERGWPMRSLASERWEAFTYAPTGPGVYTTSPIAVPGFEPTPWRSGIGLTWLPAAAGSVRTAHLPIRPLPVGFAVNTALYSALIGLPVLGLPALRRSARRRRGRCLGCGYDLSGGTGQCPECGRERTA